MFKPHGFSTRGNYRDSTFMYEMFSRNNEVSTFKYGRFSTCVQLIVINVFQLMGMTGFQLVGLKDFHIRWGYIR